MESGPAAPSLCLTGACILAVLAQAGPRRVIDLGSGYGALWAAMGAAGYRVGGVGADRGGLGPRGIGSRGLGPGDWL